MRKKQEVSPDTKVEFSNIIYRKGKRNINKQHCDTNKRLKKFCGQENIVLIVNGNIKEEHLGVKKLYLNKRGNSLFSKNLVGFINPFVPIAPFLYHPKTSENLTVV